MDLTVRGQALFYGFHLPLQKSEMGFDIGFSVQRRHREPIFLCGERVLQGIETTGIALSLAHLNSRGLPGRRPEVTTTLSHQLRIGAIALGPRELAFGISLHPPGGDDTHPMTARMSMQGQGMAVDAGRFQAALNRSHALPF